MKEFYVTLATNHGGPGYVLIYADNENEARNKAFENLGKKWAFLYKSLEDIHPLDRKLIKTIE